MSEDSLRTSHLNQIVESERSRLLSTIRARVRDQVEAEDVLQDVFEEFIASYDLGIAIEKAGAWLRAVARNKILDRFRRRKTQTDYANDVTRAQLNESNQPSESEWTRGLLREQIVDAIALLPQEQREVFVAYELEGKSYEQISAETGVGQNTLLARKRYATLFLKDYLKELYDELES